MKDITNISTTRFGCNQTMTQICSAEGIHNHRITLGKATPYATTFLSFPEPTWPSRCRANIIPKAPTPLCVSMAVLWVPPGRAVSYNANVWEAPVQAVGGNYTYFVPLTSDMAGQKLEVMVLVMKDGVNKIRPEAWVTAYPIPFISKELVLTRK